MKLRDAASLSTGSLRRNPVRTLLTVLGLGVGIGAVLTVLALGTAGQEQVEVQIARLGVDKVWVTAREGHSLTADDGESISAATHADACAGAYTAAAVTMNGQTAAGKISGYDAGMENVHGLNAVEGRLFTAREYQGAVVALVDEALSEALGGDVLGQRISVGHRKLLVVGITAATAMQGATGGTVMLPLKTFLDTFSSAGVSEVTVNVPKGQRADQVEEAVLTALGDGYQVRSLQAEIDAARSVVHIFVTVLACVAAVCMLTGGIGVMNILLVSVRERRREIGLIKAIGGTAGQVGLLFLLESVCYALLGGVLGVALGMGMVRLFGYIIGLDAMLDGGLALAAVLIAGGVGVLFGVMPALRAAALLPVDALKTMS